MTHPGSYSWWGVDLGSGLSDSKATRHHCPVLYLCSLNGNITSEKAGVLSKATKPTSRAESQFAQRGEKDGTLLEVVILS